MFPQIFGKYVLEREIAAGGMARVYLATLRGAVGFEKRLVVKQIRAELASDEAFVRRFVEEAKTSVELSHPNIVPVYELGVENGVYYIAMELCDGLTLAEVLAQTGPLEPEEGAYVGVEVCRALDYAHRRASIVHRDVTPRNVLLDEEGAVRLIDFGIAAPATPVPGAKREVFGSPGHMPLEQLRGDRLTPATDVFAVGALLIEAWTAKPPFRRATAADSEKALSTPPELLDVAVPRLSPLSTLIAGSVAASPADRPASAEALARPLREFLKSADLGDIARRLGERVRKTRRRSQHSGPWLVGDGVSAALGTPRTPVAALSGTPKTPAVGTPPGSGSGSAMPTVTRTFAAREQWTRKLPSVPPSAPPPGPDPAEDIAQPNAVASERSSLDLASSPAVSVRASTGPRARNDDDGSETTASRSLSDPARAASGWRLLAVLLAGVVIAGLITVRFSGGTSPEPPKPAAVDRIGQLMPPPSSPKSTASAVTVERAPAPPASAIEPSPRQAPTPALPKRAEAPQPSDSTTAFGRETCTLTLTANLEGTSAMVDGRGAALNAPATLPCGSHSVRFQNQTLGEKLGPEAIVLRAGEARRVLADWSSAKPRIVIVR